MDQEITAMATIAEVLEALEPEACGRVLQWAAAKYSVALPTPGTGQNGSGNPNDAINNSDPKNDGTTGYETFADLYAAASPAAESDKVLVAAYWHQVSKGEKELTSAQLNKDLANLGHKITNINMKFDTYRPKAAACAPTQEIWHGQTGAQEVQADTSRR